MAKQVYELVYKLRFWTLSLSEAFGRHLILKLRQGLWTKGTRGVE